MDALDSGGVVYYGAIQPRQNQPFIERLQAQGAKIQVWRDGDPLDAPYYVSPFGARPRELDGHSNVIDGTCPWITKTIEASRRWSSQGVFVIIMGEHGEWEAENMLAWARAEGSDGAIAETTEELLQYAERFPNAVLLSQTSFRAGRVRAPAELQWDDSGRCPEIWSRVMVAAEEAFGKKEVEVAIIVGDYAHSSQVNEYAMWLGASSNLRIWRGKRLFGLEAVYCALGPEHIEPRMFRLESGAMAKKVLIISGTSVHPEVLKAIATKISFLNRWSHGEVLHTKPCFQCGYETDYCRQSGRCMFHHNWLHEVRDRMGTG